MLKYKDFRGNLPIAVNRVDKSLRIALDEAADWMNQNADRIRVRHLSSSETQWAAHVVVWYMRRRPRAEAAKERLDGLKGRLA
jgi:hypothetical protein